MTRNSGRFTQMGILALALSGTGCGQGDLNQIDSDLVAVFDFEVDSKTMDFGDQPVGHTASDVVTIANTGETEVIIVAAMAPEGSDITVTVDRPVIQPGSAESVRLTWLPSRPGQMADKVRLQIGESREEVTEVVVAARGTAHGPGMAVSASEYDFGETPLGCEKEIELTVTNPGNEPLRVDSVLLSGDLTFALSTSEPLPWTILPFGSESFTVEFAPNDVVGSIAAVSVQSNVGQAYAQFTGSGTVDGEGHATLEIAERKASTILIHANECVIEGTFGTWAPLLEDALPTFFEELLATGNRFRVGFVWNHSGEIDSDRYIDETYSVSEATREALRQMAPGAEAGDNDRSYTTLLAAVEQNRDWLFEDEEWEASKLNLMAFNRDQEQSGGSPTLFVAEARELKSDPDDVVFHAIGGPPPVGCFGAESFEGFKVAVDMTGGNFLSICEATWHDHMRKLVAGSVVGGRLGAPTVPLTGTPLVSSIRVTLDGRVLPTHWTYDPNLNAVVFDEHFALDGRQLDVTYDKSDACGG